MKLAKQLIAPTLTLLIIGMVVTAALSVTNHFTKDRIAAAKEQTIAAAMAQLIPQATFTKNTPNEQTDVVCYIAAKDGAPVGTVVKTSAIGYKSEIEVLTAFDLQNAIIGVAVTDCADESPGIGQKVGTDDAFLAQFQGKTHAIESVDAITGATYSCNGVQEAVNQAIRYMNDPTGGAVQ